jgi:hypothetical protein
MPAAFPTGKSATSLALPCAEISNFSRVTHFDDVPLNFFVG